MIDINEVEKWIREAGKLALQEAKKDLTFQYKEDHTVVTDADRQVEQFLVDKIRKHYPHHRIVAEEGARDSGHTFSWVIDPIDGTQAYIWGLPTWCISIGILKDMKPYLGMVLVPSSGDIYYGHINGKALLNGKPIKVSCPQDIDRDAVLCVSTRILQRFRMTFPGNIISVASGVFQHSLVARGVATGSVTLTPNIWDLAGILPTLISAGGSAKYITGEDLNLEELYYGASPKPIILSHPTIFSKLCTLLQQK